MFTQFDVYQGSNPKSCSDDYVEVRNGLTDISRRIGGKYCNGNRSMLITTSRNIVRIHFHSGSASLSHKGFQISYLSITPGIVMSCLNDMPCASEVLNCGCYISRMPNPNPIYDKNSALHTPCLWHGFKKSCYGSFLSDARSGGSQAFRNVRENIKFPGNWRPPIVLGMHNVRGSEAVGEVRAICGRHVKTCEAHRSRSLVFFFAVVCVSQSWIVDEAVSKSRFCDKAVSDSRFFGFLSAAFWSLVSS